MPVLIPKILIVVFIQLLIAMNHAFRLGQLLNGYWYELYYGYASDILLPFGTYFLLSINEGTIPSLQTWYVKAGIIFSLASCSEILQYFGIYALGVTFDPLDICMYGAGVLLAAFVDVKIFANLFGFWVIPKNE